MHYRRKQVSGSYHDTGLWTSEEKFWRNVRRGGLNECWLWLGTINAYGYGYTSVNGRRAGAHRHAYELLVGPVPAGLTLDHLCSNRLCVNPRHLDPRVTGRERSPRLPPARRLPRGSSLDS